MMPSERETIANMSEGDYRWYELWSFHISQLDQKAAIIVTLDGILLALTASFSRHSTLPVDLNSAQSSLRH